ncbi:MAG: hypothetical protein GXP25_24695 [Planctomycetes bacterium]|nr:hypothetical protein [Planctomycetota bacterium]
MKHAFAIGLISLLISSTALADPPNMVKGMNPGFEESAPGQPGKPAAWNVYEGKGKVTLDPKNAHSGNFSLCLESTDKMKTPGCSLDPIPVKPSTVYKLSFWARAEPGPEGVAQGMVNASFHYLDENKKSLPLVKTDYYGRIHVYARAPTKEWTKYVGVMMSPPAARFARLGINVWRGTGKGWYDDFVIQEDPSASFFARVPDGAEGKVKYFDFGKAGAAVWPGFEAVDERTTYSKEKGYGWMRTDGRPATVHEKRKAIGGLRGLINRSKTGPQRPDALSGDEIHVSSGGVVFACDLPNGSYHVTMAVEGYGRRDWEKPDESYTITAEGEEKIAFQMTRDKMLSTDYLYKWWDRLFDPAEDAWEIYIKPMDRIREFDVEIKDGQLNMTMQGALVKYLTVCPVELKGTIREELSRIEKGRREGFYFINYSYADPPDPNPEPKTTEQGYALFARHYVTPIYPRSKPAPGELDPKSLDIFATPGEYEPTTFALYPFEKIEKVKVTASDLKAGDSVIPASEIDVRLVRWRPKPKRGKGHWEPFPECLLPRNETPLKPGLNAQFWVTVHVPADAKAGDYEGRIKIAASGKPDKSIALKLRVLPFKLAALTDRHSWSYYTYPPQRLALPMEDRRALAKAFCEELKKHSMTSIQIPRPDIKDMKDCDTFRLDFTDFDLVMQAALDAGLTADKQVFTAGANTYYFKRYGGGAFTEAYNRGYKKYLALIRDHCKEKGWSTPLIWTVDEPRERDKHSGNRNLEDTMKIDRLAKEVGGLLITVTPMGDEAGGKDYLPMLDTMDILQTHAWTRSERFISEARKRGIPWWSYNSGTSRYSWGIQCYVLDAVGRWQWHYNAYPKFPHNPVAYARSYMVVYPSPEGLIPTATFEIAREGADDYRYIHTLVQSVAKAKKTGKDTSAAETLLKEIKSLPPWAGRNVGGEMVGGFGADLFETTRGYDRLRRRVADAILALQ